MRIFYYPDRPVGNQLIQFNGFHLKFIIRVGPHSEHLILFWSYLPHSESKSCIIYFFWIPYSSRKIFQISNFFSTVSTSWEPVQVDHCASLYEALILEPKSYLIQAHKLQISPSYGLGLVVGHSEGFLEPTLSPFGFLVVKQRDKCGQLLTL